MAIQTFEYCSLQYLNQWLMYDRDYCETLSTGDIEDKLETLKSAGGFYGVARNLPRVFDEGKGYKRYEPVLEILDPVLKEQFKENPARKIKEIESKISAKYGKRSVLSLTTKFLWLKIKQPIVIYDSQARIALDIEKGDLDGFYIKWKEEFSNHKNQIAVACSRLPELHLYAIDQNIGTKEYISKISSKSWFHERVFDNYLWSKGNDS